MKQILDAAVKAFRQSFENTDNNCETYQDIRKGLSAALPHLPLGYEVKQLEWSLFNTEKSIWIAESPLGLQSIYADSEAAAQADFERRVRDCIDAKMDDVSHAGFEPYMEIVEFFDKDNTAGSFLNEDGEGGFLGAIFRMSREVEYLRSTKPVDVAAVRRQAFEEAAKTLDDLVNYWKSLPSFNRAYAMRSTIKTADDFRALYAEPAQGEQWQPTVKGQKHEN